jgi:uncharacterized membrane protein YdjX (TVP38/TMEM64 family)
VSATEPAVDSKALLVKALGITALAIVASGFCSLPSVRVWFDHAGPLADWFRSLGNLGILVFVFVSSALILVGVPRLLLCVVAGVLYKFWLGLGVSLVGSMISYYIAFNWIRGRKHKGINRTALPKSLSLLAGNPGLAGVIIGRCIPAPGMLVTTALALSNVSDGVYLFGSAIGLIPEAIPAVLCGALQRSDLKKWISTAGFATMGVVVAWVIIHVLIRRYSKKPKQGTDN